MGVPGVVVAADRLGQRLDPVGVAHRPNLTAGLGCRIAPTRHTRIQEVPSWTSASVSRTWSPAPIGAEIVEWAKRSEARGFSSLGTLDRILYESYEPLTALAAAAAVTERIGLLTAVLLGPLRTNAPLLAKQAQSVQALSGGRLTLGIGLGAREDDYEASGVETGERGRLFDQLLTDLTEAWKDGGVGPTVEAPPQPDHRRPGRQGLRAGRPVRRRLDPGAPGCRTVRRAGAESARGLERGRSRAASRGRWRSPTTHSASRPRRTREGPRPLLRLARRGGGRVHHRRRRDRRRGRPQLDRGYARPAATSSPSSPAAPSSTRSTCSPRRPVSELRIPAGIPLRDYHLGGGMRGLAKRFGGTGRGGRGHSLYSASCSCSRASWRPSRKRS